MVIAMRNPGYVCIRYFAYVLFNNYSIESTSPVLVAQYAYGGGGVSDEIDCWLLFILLY